MIEFILYYLAELLRYLVILVLGGFYGVPMLIIWGIGAKLWFNKNKSAIVDGDTDPKFDTLSRKEVNLSTGIKYDFYETQNTSGKTIRKYTPDYDIKPVPWFRS